MHALASHPGTPPAPVSASLARETPSAVPEGAHFASLLDALTAGAAPAVRDVETARLAPPPGLVPENHGIGLPLTLQTGNMLPPDQPHAGLEGSADATAADAAAADAAGAVLLPLPLDMPAVPVTHQPLPAEPALAQTAATPHALQAESKGAQPLPIIPAPTRGEAAAQRPPSEGAITVSVEPAPAERAARAPSAELPARPGSLAAPTSGGEQHDAPAGERRAGARASESPARLVAEGLGVPSKDAPTAPLLAQYTGAAASMPGAAQLATSGPLHEISAIVDRLTAARGALSPTTAALALNHSEFGEMTLRFEQQGDGRLAVALSAQDADSHRAIAAALAAERNPSFGGERPAGDSQAQGGPPRGTPGGTADRGSGNSAGHHPGSHQPRHDSPRQHSAASGWRAAASGENRQGGVYA